MDGAGGGILMSAMLIEKHICFCFSIFLLPNAMHSGSDYCFEETALSKVSNNLPISNSMAPSQFRPSKPLGSINPIKHPPLSLAMVSMTL